MSAEDGSITLAFGDGEYPFRIALGQWRELQETINRPRLEIGEQPIGPMSLLMLFRSGNAWPNDIREVIRLGLIGGGMKSDRALVLVKRYVESAAPMRAENLVVALQTLRVAMFGPIDDDAGKKKETTAEAEMTESFFPNTTASALQ